MLSIWALSPTVNYQADAELCLCVFPLVGQSFIVLQLIAPQIVLLYSLVEASGLIGLVMSFVLLFGL